MVATNPITGDEIKSQPSNDLYRENFEKIFRKPKSEVEEHELEYLVDDRRLDENDGMQAMMNTCKLFRGYKNEDFSDT